MNVSLPSKSDNSSAICSTFKAQPSTWRLASIFDSLINGRHLVRAKSKPLLALGQVIFDPMPPYAALSLVVGLDLRHM